MFFLFLCDPVASPFLIFKSKATPTRYILSYTHTKSISFPFTSPNVLERVGRILFLLHRIIVLQLVFLSEMLKKI